MKVRQYLRACLRSGNSFLGSVTTLYSRYLNCNNLGLEMYNALDWITFFRFPVFGHSGAFLLAYYISEGSVSRINCGLAPNSSSNNRYVATATFKHGRGIAVFMERGFAVSNMAACGACMTPPPPPPEMDSRI